MAKTRDDDKSSRDLQGTQPTWSFSKTRLGNNQGKKIVKVFNNDYNFRNQDLRPNIKMVDLALEQNI